MIHTCNWNKSEVVMALLEMTHISAGGAAANIAILD